MPVHPGADDFAAFFAEGWRAPTYESFCAHFLPRVHPDAVLLQPMAPRAVGHEGFRRLFRGLFHLIPRARAEVLRHAATDEGVVIEFTLGGPVGGREVRWPVTDWIALDAEGRMTERRSMFDPTRLMGALARDPRAWPRVARALRPRA